MGTFLLGSTALFLFLLACATVYFILKYIFAYSALLGLLFLFFGLPLLIRVLFIVYMGVLALLVSLFALEDTKEGPYRAESGKGDAIDVKYKIIK